MAVAVALGLAVVAVAGVENPWFLEPATRLAAFGAAGWRLRRRFLPGLAGTEGALAAFVLAVALAVAIATLLGSAGWLSGAAANAVLAACLGMLAVVGPGAPAPPSGGPRDNPKLPAGQKVDRREALAVALCVAIAFPTLAFDTRALLTRPPGAFGHDDLSYHLTTAATFRQWHDLRTPKPNFGDLSTTFYPVAGELLAWWLLAPGDGIDYLARWSELPAAAGLLLAGFALGRSLGVSRAGTALGSTLLLTIPRIFPELAHSAGNDLWTALALLATLHAASRLRLAGPAGGALYLGAALGLLIGAKYLGAVYAVLAILFAAVVGWIPRSRWLPAIPGIALAVGGVAYLRNFAGTGNPIYPQPIGLFGFELFPGVSGADLLQRREETDAAYRPLAFLVERTDLFGALFRWTLLPAALLAPLTALVAGIRGGRASERERSRLWLLLPAVLYAVFVLLVHDHRDLRYVAAVPVLAALALGWLVDRLGGAAGGWVALAGIGGVAAVLLAARVESRLGERLAATILLGAALFAAAAGGNRRGVRAARVAATLLVAGITFVAWGSRSHLERYLERRLLNRPGAEVLERLTGGRPTVVSVAGSNQEYPFLGRRLQNRLEPLPTVPRPEDRFWSFGRSPGTAAVDSAAPGLLGRLERLGVEMLVVRRGPAVRALERDLARSRRWRLAEEHRDWSYWRSVAARDRRRRSAQGETRLHQEVVPVSKPSE